MLVLHVVGARPNFMKASPVLRAFAARPGVRQCLVHTGQHYDANMSDVFFQQLGIPAPDENLEVGSGSHSKLTAEVMIRFEPVVLARKPDLVLVYGDVNSTVAAALVCAKLLVPVGHVEAGLRSGDRTMPEEINRLVTDQLADLLFTPSQDGNDNLAREGVPAEKVHLVGNVMIDTLVRLLPEADAGWPKTKAALGLAEGKYALVTLHRPSNVDDPEGLKALMATLRTIGKDVKVIFPVHPRTRSRLNALGLAEPGPGVQFMDPVGYIDFLALQKHAAVVVTDSGGVQEETTYLGVPCLTVRENTERPITCTVGMNVLVGRDVGRLVEEVGKVLAGRAKKGTNPRGWDGKAGERIAEIVTAKWKL